MPPSLSLTAAGILLKLLTVGLLCLDLLFPCIYCQFGIESLTAAEQNHTLSGQRTCRTALGDWQTVSLIAPSLYNQNLGHGRYGGCPTEQYFVRAENAFVVERLVSALQARLCQYL